MIPDPDQLSPDDVRILDVESAVITGQTLKLVILEPATDALDIESLRASVLNRLSSQPRATQRVDTSAAPPRWVESADFDIRDHIRVYADTDCTTQSDLWRIVSRLMSEHLDRSRPLWTFDVIGPLDDGRLAIAARLHHAMADGIAAVRFLDALLFDVHAPAPPKASIPVAEPPASGAGAWRMPAAVLRELGRPGSHSPFDRPITIARELAFTGATIADMKAIGASRPQPATVNDVLLGIVAGGLRTWLEAHDTIRRQLRAQIPVSLHHRAEDVSALGNRDSFINVDLPIGEADPLVRLDRISAETRERKRLDDADELYEFFHALGRIKRVEKVARRLAGSAREFSLSISNVPGPRSPVGVAGRRVQHLFSSSEPGAHHALRISAISCAGDFGIGVCGDPQALPHIARLAEAIENSYAELHSAANDRARAP
ncbi:MAG: wax ester/triacylglycerol synthase domain-containing protein [Mycobacterium sp.]